MGCNEPDVSISDGDVSPGISTHEPEWCVHEFDIEVLAVVAPASALNPDLCPTADQDHVAIRQAYVFGRTGCAGEGIAGECGGLHVGLLLYLDDLIAETSIGQIGQQGVQKVIIDLRRVESSDLVQLHRSMAPERDLLQTEQIGSRRGHFVGEQSAAGPEVGTVDDLAQLMIRMTQGKQAASTRAVKRSTDRAVDVSAEVDIARHDGNRLRATHGVSTDDCNADQRDHADDRQGRCYPKSCSPASRTVADVMHTSAALGVSPRSSSAVLVAQPSGPSTRCARSKPSPQAE